MMDFTELTQLGVFGQDVRRILIVPSELFLRNSRVTGGCLIGMQDLYQWRTSASKQQVEMGRYEF